jgi:hypothetical protein
MFLILRTTALFPLDDQGTASANGPDSDSAIENGPVSNISFAQIFRAFHL